MESIRSIERPYVQRYVSPQTHVQDVGWQGIKCSGDVAGDRGGQVKAEAINDLSFNNPLYSGSIRYQTHIRHLE